MRTVNIIFPVQNDECRLIRGIRRTSDFCEEYFPERYQITIADSGSTDETESMGRAIARSCSYVNYVHADDFSGSIVSTAFRTNTCDVVGFMDIDLSAGLEHLLYMDQMFEDDSVGIVNGSRFRRFSIIKVQKAYWKAAHFFQSAVKFLFRTKSGDAFCRFKFYRRELAEKLIPLCRSTTGWYLCAEILLRAEQAGTRIQELTVDWMEPELRDTNPRAMYWEFWKQTLRFWISFHRKQQ